MLYARVAAICWAIWKTRNRSFLEKKHIKTLLKFCILPSTKKKKLQHQYLRTATRCCSSMQCRSEPKTFSFHSKLSETIRLLAAPRSAQWVVSGASRLLALYRCVTRLFLRRRHRSTELAVPPSSPRALVQLAGQQPTHYY
jgi:hypothetical protein